MFPVANTIPVGPKVLPVVLAVGGATVASNYVRQSRIFDRSSNTAQRQPVRANLLQYGPPEPRSKFFNSVLESIFA